MLAATTAAALTAITAAALAATTAAALAAIATAATVGAAPATMGAALANAILPDITVLGPYTYLATEVVFGAAALALLVRAGAVARAARTIAVLYPVAYVWDWYTLEVGVFAIVERTGVELLGIPIEEHIFIVVVPSLVVGVHETLHDVAVEGSDDEEDSPEPRESTSDADTERG